MHLPPVGTVPNHTTAPAVRLLGLLRPPPEGPWSVSGVHVVRVLCGRDLELQAAGATQWVLGGVTISPA